jgi:hypothetical protein
MISGDHEMISGDPGMFSGNSENIYVNQIKSFAIFTFAR